MSNPHQKRQEEKRLRYTQNNISSSNNNKRLRNKKIINYTILTIVSIIVVYGLFMILQTDNGPGQYDNFAKCITSKGAIMYGTEWCPHCQAQKKEFGNSFKYITFIDCDANKVICDLAGVKGYPTWIFTDETRISGEQKFSTLSERTNCSLN